MTAVHLRCTDIGLELPIVFPVCPQFLTKKFMATECPLRGYYRHTSVQTLDAEVKNKARCRLDAFPESHSASVPSSKNSKLADQSCRAVSCLSFPRKGDAISQRNPNPYANTHAFEKRLDCIQTV